MIDKTNNSFDLEHRLDEILAELEKEQNDEEMALRAYYEVETKLGLTSFSTKLKTICRWSKQIFAILFIPAVISMIWLALRNDSPAETRWAEINVPVGQTQKVTLPDGTILSLNGGSRVTYPDRFTEDSREVFIEGEIFADVAKDPKRPFTFHNADLSLIVYGTKFNFKSYGDSEYSEVILIDGSVRLDLGHDGSTRSVDMVPGDLVQYNHQTNAIDIKSVDVIGYKPFYEDRALHYYNLPIKEIATDLERIFGVKIVVRNMKLADEKYLAFFSNNETLDEILHSFDTGGKIKVTRDNNVIYLDAR